MENIFETIEIENGEDLVEEMMEESEAIVAIFQDLVVCKEQHGLENTVFCFYEGKDDFKFYPNKIQQILLQNGNEKGIYSKGCGCKENVIDIYSKLLFDSIDIIENSLFFVDRDFDENDGLGENIYITPTYSIENLYAEEYTFDMFVNVNCYINRRSVGKDFEDYEFLKYYYKSNLLEKLNEILLINAWYSLQIKNKDLAQPVSLKKLQQLSKIKNSTQKNKLSEVDLQDLENLTDNYKEVSIFSLQEEMNYLRSDILSKLRGKHVEEIIVDIYKKIVDECNNPTNFPIENRNIPLQIGKKNFKSVLMGYTRIPQCLIEYVNTRLHS